MARWMRTRRENLDAPWRSLPRGLMFLGIVCGLWIYCTLSSPQLAYGEASSDETPASAAKLLAGPKISERAMNADASTFDRNRSSAPSIRVGAWIRCVNDLTLTIEQQAGIKAIVSEFQQNSRDFQKSHGEELRVLRKSVRQSREAKQPPNPEQLRRLRVLQARSPVAAQYQMRIWRSLTTGQQEDLREELERLRHERTRKKSRGGASGDGTLFIPTKVSDTRQKPETVGGKQRDPHR